MAEVAEAPVQETTQPLSVDAFAAKIKEKYPQYKDVDNTELTKKIVEKYPEYKDKVSFQSQPQTVDKPIPLDDPYDVAAKERAKNEPKESPTANILADVLGAPGRAYHEGLKESGKTLKEGFSKLGSVNPVESITGELQVIEGFGKGALSLAQFIPAMTAFTVGSAAVERGVEAIPESVNTAFQAIGQPTPKQTVDFVQAPARTTLNAVIEDAESKDQKLKDHPVIKFLKESQAVQSTVGLVDMGLPLLAGVALNKGKVQLSKDLVDGKDLSDKGKEDLKEVVNTTTENDIRDVATQVVVDAQHPDAAHLKEKEIKLTQSAIDAGTVLGAEDATKIFEPEIKKAQADFAQQTQNINAKAKLEQAKEFAK